MKQIQFRDIENDVIHGGILTDDGDVICGCCGGLIPADELDDIEIIKVYSDWKNIDEAICGENVKMSNDNQERPAQMVQMDKNGNLSISVDSAAGTFGADIETEEMTGYNAIYLTFTPDGSKDKIDIAAIKDVEGTRDIRLLMYGNISREEPTVDNLVSRDEIEDAIEE